MFNHGGKEKNTEQGKNPEGSDSINMDPFGCGTIVNYSYYLSFHLSGVARKEIIKS
jgi:hypothetical protein